MLSGFNNNFRYRGVLFHVQTEDSGVSNPHVITHLFHGGNILDSEKLDYSDKLGLSAGELEDAVRELMPKGDFIEAYVAASLETCESRDVKGLYKKARAGEIPEFTGISAPYEEPEKPELLIDTNDRSVEQCVDQVIAYLEENGYLSAPTGV